jgi:hypothetical protein
MLEGTSSLPVRLSPMKRIAIVTVLEQDNRTRAEQCLMDAAIPLDHIRQDQPGYLSVYVEDAFVDSALTVLRRAQFSAVLMPG